MQAAMVQAVGIQPKHTCTDWIVDAVSGKRRQRGTPPSSDPDSDSSESFDSDATEPDGGGNNERGADQRRMEGTTSSSESDTDPLPPKSARSDMKRKKAKAKKKQRAKAKSKKRRRRVVSSDDSDQGSENGSESEGSDSEDESNATAKLERRKELKKAARSAGAMRKTLGIEGIPEALRLSNASKMYRELGLGTSATQTHLDMQFTVVGWMHGTVVPSSTPTEDPMFRKGKTALLLKYFLPDSVAGGLRQKTAAMLANSKGRVVVESDLAAEVTVKGGARRLFILASMRLHWLLHLSDASHPAFLKPDQTIGAINYVMWVGIKEMEGESEALLMTDNALMAKRMRGEWDFGVPQPVGFYAAHLLAIKER